MTDRKKTIRYRAGLRRTGRKAFGLKRLLFRGVNPRTWSLRARIVYLSGALLILGNVILILFLAYVLNAGVERTGEEALEMFARRVREAVAAEERLLGALARVTVGDAASAEARRKALEGDSDGAVKALAVEAESLSAAVGRPVRVWLAMGEGEAVAVHPPEEPDSAVARLGAALLESRTSLRGVIESGSGLLLAAGAAPQGRADRSALILGVRLFEVLSALRPPRGYGVAVIAPVMSETDLGPALQVGRTPDLAAPVEWRAGRARQGDWLLRRVELPGYEGGPAAVAALAYDTRPLDDAVWNRIYQFSWFFISGAILLWVALFVNVSRVERFLGRLRSIIIASHANDFAERFESDHVHCLEIMHCHNEECPVHQNPNLVCHLETGSEAISPRWRDTCVFLNVYESCASCPVYALRRGDELNEMRNVVNTMMRLWGQFLTRVGELLSHVLRTHSSTGRVPSLDEISDRLEQMARLTAFSQDLQGALNKQEIYDQLAWVFESHFGLDTVVVLEVKPEGKGLELAWDGSGDRDMASLETAASPESCRAVRTAADVVSQRNPALCPYFNCDHDKELRCCLPVIMSGQVGAVLSFVAPRRHWDRISDLLPVMRKYLDESGPVLSSLRLLGLTKDQALRDPLTHAHNRRFLDEFLASYEPLSEREGTRTGLLMADIDHFKLVNDEHGHEAGDAVLKEAAGIMAGRIRRSDLLIRYGGEEFLMLLRNASPGSAEQVAEDIRRAVEEHEFALPSGGFVHKTVSIGVCEHPDDAPSLNKAINAADAALYECKRKGRNRVMRCPDAQAAKT
ncbi:MAG: diguanylate cyclase [Desulfovibrionaceae bacterium]